jgi:uncharacterized protein
MRLTRFVHALLAGLAASALPQPALATDALAPVAVEKQAIVDVDPALWVIKDEDTTVYLFGTVHVLKPGLGWFDDGVKAAFDKSDQLVLELVELPMDEQMKIMAEISTDASGNKLTSKLNEAQRLAFEKTVSKLGIPLQVMDPLDPWAAAVTVYMVSVAQQGFDPAQGAEAQLKAAAKVANKPVSGLETLREQLGFFDNLPQETQLRYLNETVSMIDDTSAQLDQLVDFWAKAEPEKLAELMNKGMSDPVLMDAILYKRNANWATWINSRMAKPGTVFLAVGAAHLAGEKSVQDLLVPFGHKAERVAY